MLLNNLFLILCLILLYSMQLYRSFTSSIIFTSSIRKVPKFDMINFDTFLSPSTIVTCTVINILNYFKGLSSFFTIYQIVCTTSFISSLKLIEISFPQIQIDRHKTTFFSNIFYTYFSIPSSPEQF